MKTFCTIPAFTFLMLFFGLAHDIKAQDTKLKHLYELISAEKAFAEKAHDSSIKAAFLDYLDSTGTVYNDGVAVNGLTFYGGAPDDSTNLLSWYPVFAKVADSGELGFSSGPYQYYSKRGNGPDAGGYFFSLWRRNPDGEFKVILDAGVAHYGETVADIFKREPEPAGDNYHFDQQHTAKNEKRTMPWQAENDFINLAKTEVSRAYQAFFSEEGLTLRNNQMPGRSKKTNAALIKPQETGYVFDESKKGVSNSGDLAFTYGLVKSSGKGEAIGNYIRVWGYEKDGWKILADVLNLNSPTN